MFVDHECTLLLDEPIEYRIFATFNTESVVFHGILTKKIWGKYQKISWKYGKKGIFSVKVVDLCDNTEMSLKHKLIREVVEQNR